MSWYDYIPQVAAYNWLSGSSGPGSANAATDRNYTQGFLNQGSPYVQASPQAGNYASLISMLQQRANGQGPSVAGDAYKQAAANAMNSAASLSHGSSAGAAREAMQQMGNVNQGLAQGYSAARNQEMTSATGQLGSAIGGADNSDLQRSKANQDAWLQMLQQQFGLDRAQLPQAQNNGQVIGGIIQGAGGIAKLAGA